jgi:succinyl-CoA synthetase beta subunit
MLHRQGRVAQASNHPCSSDFSMEFMKNKFPNTQLESRRASASLDTHHQPLPCSSEHRFGKLGPHGIVLYTAVVPRRAMNRLVRSIFRVCSSQPTLRYAGKRFDQVRYLNIHEYQSQELLRSYGVPVPAGEVAATAAGATAAARKLLSTPREDVVVKAQVLAGGRGLGFFQPSGFRGGVHIASSVTEAQELAQQMLGQQLVTKQTGAKGRPCHKVLVSQRLYARREMYLALLYDREVQGPLAIVSRRGGTSIEDIAQETPEAIQRIPLSLPARGGSMDASTAAQIASALGLSAQRSQELHRQGMELVQNLYKLFLAKDCTLIEVNPLTETPDGHIVCVDAKINFDDNAAFRQPEVFALRDTTQEDAREVDASRFGLNYIGLDGNIGCMVNGAGLAMATMDLIKLYGGNPANFLDVGGGATVEQVGEAFRILNQDAHVDSILINIFGGIMRCDVLAQGIVDAAKRAQVRVPLVVRLEGNRMAEAKEIMRQSTVKIIPAESLDEAAKRAVKIADIVGRARDAGVQVEFRTVA